MDTTDDDLIASLESSLLRDLLADDTYNCDTLASLEAQLDASLPPPSLSGGTTAPPSNSAANLVISHYNQRSLESNMINNGSSSINNMNNIIVGEDAWSQSYLNQFNANAVDDFLKADNERKQKTAAAATLLAPLEDYDLEDVPDIPRGLGVGGGLVMGMGRGLPRPPPNGPPPGLTVAPTVTHTRPSTVTHTRPSTVTNTRPNSMAFPKPPPGLPGPAPPPGMALPTPPPPPPGIPLAYPHQPQPFTPKHSLPATITSMPPPFPLHHPPNLYNHPHPHSPPLPIRTSSLMPPRDISYIVTSILRSLHTTDFYFSHYTHIHRTKLAADAAAATAQQSSNVITAIAQKSKEWKVEKKVLGQVFKTDVQRPRALLDITVVATNKEDEEDEDEESLRDRERDILWNCRRAIESFHYDMLSGDFIQIKDKRKEDWRHLWGMEKGRVLIARSIERHQLDTTVVPRLIPFLIGNGNDDYDYDYDCSVKKGEDRVWRAIVDHLAWKMTPVEVRDTMALLLEKYQARLKESLLLGGVDVRSRRDVVHAILNRGRDVCDKVTWDVIESQFQMLMN